MISVSTALTELGLALLVTGYFPAFLFLRWVLMGSVPEKLPSESYAKVIVVKVVFAILLAILASGGGGGGPFSFAAALPASLGGGYFISSMVLDMFFLALLWRGEFYGAAKIVMFNLPCVPFLTSLAVGYGLFVEQGKTIRRVRGDLPVREDGVLLGYAVWLMRSIRKPVRGLRDVDVRPHNDIRPLPIEPAVYYSPKIGDRDLNPHMLIAGSSGTGKTTTIYSIVRNLSKNYPVVFVDVKGDITRGLLSDDAPSYILPVAQVGFNPFARTVDGETERESVEDLMESISVVEPVGSRQAHYIREAYAEIYHSGKQLTHSALVGIIDRMEKESVSITSPESRRGPGTRDALFSISSKLKDLSEYLRDEGVSLKTVLDKAVEGRESNFPIVVINLEGISEKIRAIVLELILRKISKYLFRRGPLAYLTDVPLVLVVDEAYLVTKPMDRRGMRGGESRSVLETIARAGRSYGVALILVTQRLSDIADGIRQNCEKWLVFRTSSPDDLRVLEVDDRVLGEVVTQLGKGHAYIRVVTGRRIEGIRYTSDITATTIGYIFRMERQPLKIEGQDNGYKDKDLIVCYRCKLAVKSPQHCPFCGEPPLLTPVAEPEEARVKAESSAVSTSRQPQMQVSVSAATGGSATVLTGSVDWEEVRRRAVEKCPYDREKLQSLTADQVKDFVTNYPSNANSYAKLGLVRLVSSDGKFTLKRAGEALLQAYREVVAGK